MGSEMCIRDSNIPVQRPVQTETTALGAAYLAGLHCGVYSSPEDLAGNWQLDREFTPDIDAEKRDEMLAAWKKAVDGLQQQSASN